MASQFRELASEILELQKLWSHDNSTAMQRRGILVRDDLPRWLTASIGSTWGDAPAYSIQTQGRDGTGRKTEIPWVRVFSPEHSPNAREGWYCVLLFHARGEGLYLAVSHGSTRWENGSFKPRSNEELNTLVAWARSSLADTTKLNHKYASLDLGAKGNLGESYQRGAAASVWYPLLSLPSDEDFVSDIGQFLDFLKTLYDAESLGRSPEYIAQQASDIIQITEEIARPSKKNRARGQGFGLSAPERLAVELRAMKVADEILRAKGFSTADVSRNSSFDFIAKDSSGAEIIVEVKGSTGFGDSIILTAGEVAAHRERHPNNALIIVHSIALDRKSKPPRAEGGKARVFWSWDISSTKLEALSFQCLISGQN